MTNKKYSFFKTSEGAVFIGAWIIFAVAGLLFYIFGFRHWGGLLKMLLTGHFVGKGASIPMGINFLHNKWLAALVVYLQDIVSLFIVFPLVILLKKKIIKNRIIEDTFVQAEDIVREHRWIKTFGVVGVAFCVLFPFQPITGPITASVIGILISLPSWLNLITVTIASAVSVVLWVLFYGQIFELTKSINQGIITAISVITMVIVYVTGYIIMIRRKMKQERENLEAKANKGTDLNIENEHSLPSQAVMEKLSTGPDGISEREAGHRLEVCGPNEITEQKKRSLLVMFFSQFNNFLVYILIAAVIVSMLLGEWIDSAVIIFTLILNAILGFIQESKAEKSIEALKKLSGLKARVVRAGHAKEIPAGNLVPGDLILVEVGSKVPADARVIESMNLEVQEAALTGESLPVSKHSGELESDTILADRKNMIYSGTIITAGHARAVVTKTGMSTQIGNIAELIQEVGSEQTPLQKKLDFLGSWLGWAIVFICIFVSLSGILRGGKVFEMVIVGVSLAVAAIPEGLAAVVTICLAIGVQKMLKRHALIRRLPLVETLGCVTVICSDKTGTLTCNEMTVKKLFINNKTVDVSGSGYIDEGEFSVNGKAINTGELELLLKIGALNNNSILREDSLIGDPTEIALTVCARKADLDESELNLSYPRIEEIGFDSERKMMTTVHNSEGKKVVYAKGATEEVLAKCRFIYENGNVRNITEQDHKIIMEKNIEFAGLALRVLAFAFREVKDQNINLDNTEKDLVFVGLQAMIDPPRPGVLEAIKKCRDAGIKVVMITGDFLATAQAIAKEIGLQGKALTGKDLDSGIVLDDIAEDTVIYARVNPVHKIKIVEALKKKGHIVAMTGDGVNDAPALKKSDIGIAMGLVGTDVAREASGMILTDDNFTSIVNAVEEGRTIYDNIKKFIAYLLSCNMGEVLTLFIAMMIAFKDKAGAILVPLTAVQILWMNLVTDGLPAFALSMDPAGRDVMSRLPRDPKEKVITKNMVFKIFTIGLLMSLGTLYLFNWSLCCYNIEAARTVAFTSLVVFQILIAMIRNQQKGGLFSNIYLLVAMASSLLLQVLVVYVPVFNRIFKTVPLGWNALLHIGIVGVIIYLGASSFSVLIRKYTKQRD